GAAPTGRSHGTRRCASAIRCTPGAAGSIGPRTNLQFESPAHEHHDTNACADPADPDGRRGEPGPEDTGEEQRRADEMPVVDLPTHGGFAVVALAPSVRRAKRLLLRRRGLAQPAMQHIR